VSEPTISDWRPTYQLVCRYFSLVQGYSEVELLFKDLSKINY